MALYNIATTGVFPSEFNVGDTIYLDTTNNSYRKLLPIGKYIVQVWGAQGCNTMDNGTSRTPNGGYASGILDLTEPTFLIFRVGGAGQRAQGEGTISGGYNGGGAGWMKWSTTRYRGSGGGASDIRINTDSLYHRVIVAAGGGACNDTSSSAASGSGSGGGLNGENGEYSTGGGPTSRAGGAGKSTSGGAHSTDTSFNKNQQDGGFGYGGGYKDANETTQGFVRGGGGGWYGGGAAGPDGCAGGGSSYVWSSEWASYTTHLGSAWKLTSKHYMKYPNTIAGYTSVPQSNTSSSQLYTGTQTGKTGNGFIRLDVLYQKPSYQVYRKVNGAWILAQK